MVPIISTSNQTDARAKVKPRNNHAEGHAWGMVHATSKIWPLLPAPIDRKISKSSSEAVERRACSCTPTRSSESPSGRCERNVGGFFCDLHVQYLQRARQPPPQPLATSYLGLGKESVHDFAFAVLRGLATSVLAHHRCKERRGERNGLKK